jgi:hypothetical protein
MKISRKTQWEDIIVNFVLLKDLDVINAKDIVDYFMFKYLTIRGFTYWVVPNYKTQVSCAKKLISLYGPKLTIDFIDILFDKYSKIFNKGFNDIVWSLGILSSDKSGWVLDKILEEYYLNKKITINNILNKKRSNWTDEEFEYYKNYLKEKENGKKEEK